MTFTQFKKGVEASFNKNWGGGLEILGDGSIDNITTRYMSENSVEFSYNLMVENYNRIKDFTTITLYDFTSKTLYKRILVN